MVLGDCCAKILSLRCMCVDFTPLYDYRVATSFVLVSVIQSTKTDNMTGFVTWQTGKYSAPRNSGSLLVRNSYPTTNDEHSL